MSPLLPVGARPASPATYHTIQSAFAIDRATQASPLQGGLQ
ncbi:MAG: hypothetical protein QM754_10445 [Tepidisphaeraceae bacterium]